MVMSGPYDRRDLQAPSFSLLIGMKYAITGLPVSPSSIPDGHGRGLPEIRLHAIEGVIDHLRGNAERQAQVSLTGRTEGDPGGG